AVRIELETERAWCGERLLDLAPKAFAILRHFVEHPERLLTKEDLFAAVWGDTVLSEAALTSCIRDRRRALAATSRAPRYIETVHRRGFRLIGPIGRARSVATAPPKEVGRSPTMVGRDAELARLDGLFEMANRRRPGAAVRKCTTNARWAGSVGACSQPVRSPSMREGRYRSRRGESWRNSGLFRRKSGLSESARPECEKMVRSSGRSHGGAHGVRSLRRHEDR